MGFFSNFVAFLENTNFTRDKCFWLLVLKRNDSCILWLCFINTQSNCQNTYSHTCIWLKKFALAFRSALALTSALALALCFLHSIVMDQTTRLDDEHKMDLTVSEFTEKAHILKSGLARIKFYWDKSKQTSCNIPLVAVYHFCLTKGFQKHPTESTT